MNIWSDDALAHGGLWPNHSRYQQACDAAWGELTLASTLHPFTPDIPTVICVVHNEERRLQAFLDHYKKLGVQSIHLVDHASSDRTADIAANDACVTLWKTRASYARAAFGQLWIGAIARRFGLNRWILNVDADEFLAYTGMASRSLADVQRLLESKALERIFTPLVDLYIDKPLLQASGSARNPGTLLFDGRTDKGDPYHFDDSPFGPRMTGGPRARMMASIGAASNPWLSKFALSRWNSQTAYANVHFPYPFQWNKNNGFAALLHLKLVDDFEIKVADAIVEGEHYRAAQEYKAYNRWLKTQGMRSLVSPELSAPYTGPQSLVRAKVLQPLPW